MSLASVAISHGVNPNVMRRWVADANDRALPSAGTAQAVLAQPDVEDALVLQRDADVATCAPAAAASFVPVKVEAAAPALPRIENQARDLKFKQARPEKVTFELARLKAWRFSARTEAMNAEQREMSEEALGSTDPLPARRRGGNR